MTRLFLTAVLTYVAGAVGALACPDLTLQGDPYEANGQQLIQARHFAVEAGGSFDIGRCRDIEPRTDAGPGFFDQAPHFSFQVNDLDEWQLMISVISQCDATLLVATPRTAWYYDDNDNGAPHPRLVFSTPASGRWDIWVGTRDGAFCDAILSMETFER